MSLQSLIGKSGSMFSLNTDTHRQWAAALAWRRIQDKPASITIDRMVSGTEITLDAQTVRVEPSERPRMRNTAIETPSGRQGIYVLGIQDHAALPDTDIEENDYFTYLGRRYHVVSVDREYAGEIQAFCEAQA